MIKKEMIAMLLAGGQGSRLGVLTEKVAKPAVAFGGKYRIIDFPLSNCINSGIDTVGVLTQYQPLRLNEHIGIGIPWDLDRNVGGVSILPPYEKSTSSEWYTGTANAIFQNMAYMERFNPDYVLILSGDHIYKMDYQVMLDYHKANKADVTIACMHVPIEEASRFGVMTTDGNGRITEFEEKPDVDLYVLEKKVKEAVQQDLPVSYYDVTHVQIGDYILECLGPRMHITSTGKIEDFTLVKDYPQDPRNGYYMLVGILGKQGSYDLKEFNRIALSKGLSRKL